MSRESSADHDQVTASADNAAVAALRELPEARILVFDRELRFILAAGQTLEHDAYGESAACRMGGESTVCRVGAFVGDAFPESLWKLIEPLCRSALAGET
jgi:hypothetical protein